MPVGVRRQCAEQYEFAFVRSYSSNGRFVRPRQQVSEAYTISIAYQTGLLSSRRAHQGGTASNLGEIAPALMRLSSGLASVNLPYLATRISVCFARTLPRAMQQRLVWHTGKASHVRFDLTLSIYRGRDCLPDAFLHRHTSRAHPLPSISPALPSPILL